MRPRRLVAYGSSILVGCQILVGRKAEAGYCVAIAGQAANRRWTGLSDPFVAVGRRRHRCALLPCRWDRARQRASEPSPKAGRRSIRRLARADIAEQKCFPRLPKAICQDG
jgi:hypothetical protein